MSYLENVWDFFSKPDFGYKVAQPLAIKGRIVVCVKVLSVKEVEKLPENRR